jgi:CBS domain-containing protein
MKARELMTQNPACCTTEQTVREVAELMRDHDCGCVPVVEDTKTNRVIGVVTDRDITCRCIAEGKGSETAVSEVMTRHPTCCGPDDDVTAVEQIMTAGQVRRVPVVDDRGCCVGIIAQADLALNERAASDRDVGRVVGQISTPAHEGNAAKAHR